VQRISGKQTPEEHSSRAMRAVRVERERERTRKKKKKGKERKEKEGKRKEASTRQGSSDQIKRGNIIRNQNEVTAKRCQISDIGTGEDTGIGL
jgi:hypothetical protein